MTRPVTHFFTLALAAVCATAAAGAQAITNQPAAATTPTNVARVYVQTAAGVNVYTTSSTGKLTLVSGSPFKNTAGLMIGTAGSHLITVGTNYLHSYAIKSTGGIGAQLAQMNSALYPGAECGTTHGGTIDRTGTNAYIRLDGAESETCHSLQTFNINATTGAFTFGGVAYPGGGSQPPTFEGPLVVAGNNGHAYTFSQYYCEQTFSSFYRDRFGAMNTATPTITFPPPNGGEYFPSAMASDNQNLRTSHMAVAIHEDFLDCGNNPSPLALAAYTVDYSGNLFYGGAMLKLAINAESMAINPQGNLLAVSAATSNPFTTKDGPGLQVFHFKGAEPITGYSNILTKNPIDSIAWDKSYHLYATSHAANKLYVFTITPTSITPAAGSPFTLSGPSTLVVRPF